MNFYKNKFFGLIILIAQVFVLGCDTKKDNASAANITKAEIRLLDGSYSIYLNDVPFYAKGAGVEHGNLELLAEHGANAFRTWRTDNGKRSGKEVLDHAQKLGLKVMMGIDVGLERLGFDYNDQKAVEKQFNRIQKEVMDLKDHPALIIWAIGNELNHHATNPKVWDAVNDISKMIHEIDPYHLTTTPISGMDKSTVELIEKRAPDVDFLSIQMYGAIEILPEIIKNLNYEKPLMVTEWGATGYWEVPKTSWGAPIENNSSIKADFYLQRYRKSIEAQSDLVIGSFVFLWGQKQERTPTWFGMFLPDGNESESIDVMHFVWKGEWPENRSPRLEDFTLESERAEDNIELKPDGSYSALVKVSDPDNDSLSYHWEIMNESQSRATGGDAEIVPEAIKGLFSGNPNVQASFSAPSDSGAYRLFVYIEDGHRHTAHANIPFLVKK
ncbi:MAG: glycoside hydrolase family 2 TIM barrel-domain containing protein [Cytophagales bacterium]